MKKFLLIFLALALVFSLAACAPDVPPVDTEDESIDEPEVTLINLDNTVWEGENWLVFLPDWIVLCFDETGTKLGEGTYEWNGALGTMSVWDMYGWVSLEGDDLVCSIGDNETRSYTRTDRIPGTDPSRGYVLKNTTWRAGSQDKYVFFEDGTVGMYNWSTYDRYDGTYTWDPMEGTGTLDMGEYTSPLTLTEDGYLLITGKDGTEEYFGRRPFDPVVDPTAPRGQEDQLKGTWTCQENGVSMTFDGACGVVYTTADGETHVFTEHQYGYFFDGSKLTLFFRYDVTTGLPERAFGTLLEDGSLEVDGYVFYPAEA